MGKKIVSSLGLVFMTASLFLAAGCGSCGDGCKTECNSKKCPTECAKECCKK